MCIEYGEVFFFGGYFCWFIWFYYEVFNCIFMKYVEVVDLVENE